MTPTPLTPQINVASRPARQSVTTTTLVSGRRRVNAYLGKDIANEKRCVQFAIENRPCFKRFWRRYQLVKLKRFQLQFLTFSRFDGVNFITSSQALKKRKKSSLKYLKVAHSSFFYTFENKFYQKATLDFCHTTP